MNTILIKNAKIVNEGKMFEGDLLINKGRIEKIAGQIDMKVDMVIDATNKILMPGVIDDQVHFREPGMEHKATVFTESRAALAGGVTSFMDMPNTKPASLTQELLQKRYDYAALNSAANYSFYMGTSNDNLDEVLKTDPVTVCGVKIFMGSSTGNMLVDEPGVLQSIFANSPMLIATHCEDEATIKHNNELFIKKYGENLSAIHHPQIRSDKACYLSSSFAVDLARKNDTRLHVLHLTSALEMDLFDFGIPLAQKKITTEVCVHHLFFNESQYPSLGNMLKCNPAVKSKSDQDALWRALLEDRLDVIATDHAPHAKEEKEKPYVTAPSGLPLVQHSLTAMLEFYHQGKISLERIVEKMCHAPAEVFKIKDRGYIREGYYADLVLVDLNDSWQVDQDNIRYKCGWSPFEGYTFGSKVSHTFVNGNLVFADDKILEVNSGMRLHFNRD